MRYGAYAPGSFWIGASHRAAASSALPMWYRTCHRSCALASWVFVQRACKRPISNGRRDRRSHRPQGAFPPALCLAFGQNVKDIPGHGAFFTEPSKADTQLRSPMPHKFIPRSGVLCRDRAKPCIQPLGPKRRLYANVPGVAASSASSWLWALRLPNAQGPAIKTAAGHCRVCPECLLACASMARRPVPAVDPGGARHGPLPASWIPDAFLVPVKGSFLPPLQRLAASPAHSRVRRFRV